MLRAVSSLVIYGLCWYLWNRFVCSDLSERSTTFLHKLDISFYCSLPCWTHLYVSFVTTDLHSCALTDFTFRVHV